MIRTLAEVHADRVTVTVTLDTEASIERLYTSAEVGDLQASEARLVAEPLARQVDELERKLAESRELVAFKTRVNDDIQHDLTTWRERADTFKAQAYEQNERAATERRRASELKDRLSTAQDRVAELERALAQSIDRENRMETDRADLEETHRRSLAARDRLLESATRRIGAARDFLTAGTVAEARENIVTSRGAVLADAIGNTLRVLDKA